MPFLLNLSIDKSEWRRLARERRRAIVGYARMQAEDAIADHLEKQALRQAWRRVGAYASVASEASLSPWFERTRSGVQLSLPAIDADGVMRFRTWSPTTALVAGPYSIPQPVAQAPVMAVESMDAVLLPLLAFDSTGTRLGSGAGYYDRAFALRHCGEHSPQLVGIGFAAQAFERLPRESWDIPLDAVVTEHGWMAFPGVDADDLHANPARRP
jgi:5-formyltetrahydrofolate cyclo-ligase